MVFKNADEIDEPSNYTLVWIWWIDVLIVELSYGHTETLGILRASQVTVNTGIKWTFPAALLQSAQLRPETRLAV